MAKKPEPKKAAPTKKVEAKKPTPTPKAAPPRTPNAPAVIQPRAAKPTTPAPVLRPAATPAAPNLRQALKAAGVGGGKNARAVMLAAGTPSGTKPSGLKGALKQMGGKNLSGGVRRDIKTALAAKSPEAVARATQRVDERGLTPASVGARRTGTTAAQPRTPLGAGTGLMMTMDAAAAAKQGKKVPKYMRDSGFQLGNKTGRNAGIQATVKKGWAPGGVGTGTGKQPLGKPPPTTVAGAVTTTGGGVPVAGGGTTTPPAGGTTTTPATVQPKVTQNVNTVKPATVERTQRAGGTSGGTSGFGGDAYGAANIHASSGQNQTRKGSGRFRFA